MIDPRTLDRVRGGRRSSALAADDILHGSHGLGDRDLPDPRLAAVEGATPGLVPFPVVWHWTGALELLQARGHGCLREGQVGDGAGDAVDGGRALDRDAVHTHVNQDPGAVAPVDLQDADAGPHL